MSFSSGVFSINSTGQPVVTGTTISSTVFNALTADIATGLSSCMLKDGTQTLTANIPFGGFKITGLTSGTAAADSATFLQAQSASLLVSYLTGVSGTNTITTTALTPVYALAVGQRFWLTPANTNTGAVTLQIGSNSAGAVQWVGGALTGGEIVANRPLEVQVTAATPVFEIVAPTQFPDTRALVVGGTDATKKVRFEVDGLTTGITRVVTVPDRDLTIGLVLGTPTASTSGTSIDFTGIPSGTKRITITLKGISTNGTSNKLIQIGDAGGIETSGYLGTSGTTNFTAGFGIESGSAADVLHGQFILTLENAAAFTWLATGILGLSNAGAVVISGGSKSTTAELDRVRITTSNGTDAFDAGEINIAYE